MKASQIFFRILNLIAITGSVMNIVALLDSQTSPLEKINGVFHMFLVVFLLTIKIQEVPPPSIKYFSLYKFLFGRGLFFIWISMILRNSVLSIIGSSITGLTGIFFIVSGMMENCCCGNSRSSIIEYEVLNEPESSLHAVSDYHPTLPVYTKNDPRRS